MEVATAPPGFSPTLSTEGLLDSEVPEAVADYLIPVHAKALRDVARHANASALDVDLVVERWELVLTVTDDGSGIPQDVKLSGLANMRERAAGLAGEFVREVPPGGDTRLRWRVPLFGHAEVPTTSGDGPR
ncbi:hypothetical protein AV521_39740 [Streptomyces sp. IMTB 2501]|uniref:sensor histidine kinase n=1 Tax=Streptomyces sp. IMTB 2501 TaxID=1776340 RepID=UPI00096ED3D1|nr:hypothetical protein [Streptomyces sp. IMTB 2501]OLZ63137.1 hypothetical protein AV521_39740 [Streptomyces sp. IMTB 2501]